MEVEQYSPEDKKEIIEFVSKNLQEIFNSPASNIQELEDISNNFVKFLVVWEKEKIIGTAGLKLEKEGFRVSRMYVSREKRNKGIGTMLIRELLKYCKGQSNRIFLTTYEQMNSVNFYKKMGFRVFKREKDLLWMEYLY